MSLQNLKRGLDAGHWAIRAGSGERRAKSREQRAESGEQRKVPDNSVRILPRAQGLASCVLCLVSYNPPPLKNGNFMTSLPLIIRINAVKKIPTLSS